MSWIVKNIIDNERMNIMKRRKHRRKRRRKSMSIRTNTVYSSVQFSLSVVSDSEIP